MDDAERIDQVEGRRLQPRGQFLGIRLQEIALQPEYLEPLAGQRQARVRQVDAGVVGAGTCKVDRIGAQSTADLQHAAATPARELRELRNMRLDEIFALFNFIEVLARTEFSPRMPYVAR